MRRSSGFTLLEVMVAMTITALALGSLFSVIAGNKRLAWRAEAALLHSIEVRSLINSAQLNDMQGEAFTEARKDKLQLTSDEELTVPKRKTQATSSDLRGFHIKDEHGAELASGTYWIHLQLPANSNNAGQSEGLQQGGPTTLPGAFPNGGRGPFPNAPPGTFPNGGRGGFPNAPPGTFPPGQGGNFPQRPPPGGFPQGGQPGTRPGRFPQ